MNPSSTATMDDYELGLAVVRANGDKLAHLQDPAQIEQLGRWIRPALNEMADAAAATARLVDTLNREHPELTDALERFAKENESDA